MRRHKVLQSGAVSASTRRRTTLLLVLLAWAARLWTHYASGRAVPEAPAPLLEYLTSSAWPWVDPPLPGLVLALAASTGFAGLLLLLIELLATTIVVLTLVRLGERWLDFEAAVIGAALWAVCAPALSIFRLPSSEGWQAAVAMMIAGAMLTVARRRLPETSWRIGALAGLLSLFSGGGLWWVVGALVWLPFTSPRFRGWGFARSAALVVAGWLVVVMPLAVRNAAVSGGDPRIPGAGHLATLHATVHAGTVRAPDLAARLAAGTRGPASVAYTDSVLTTAGLEARASEWSRSVNVLTLALQEAGQDGGAGFRQAGRRMVATVGGWAPPDAHRELALPWVLVVLFAWVGVVALLPATRPLFPLLLGGLVPIAQAAVLGVSASILVAASPFVCLFSGYGIWRIWTGRRWALTWAIVPVALALAALFHLWVRTWV